FFARKRAHRTAPSHEREAQEKKKSSYRACGSVRALCARPDLQVRCGPEGPPRPSGRDSPEARSAEDWFRKDETWMAWTRHEAIAPCRCDGKPTGEDQHREGVLARQEEVV